MAPQRQRSLVITTLVVAVLVLSVAGFALIADRQTVRSVDDAVTAFRDGRSSAAGPTDGSPADGAAGVADGTSAGKARSGDSVAAPEAARTSPPPAGSAGPAADRGGGAPADGTSSGPTDDGTATAVRNGGTADEPQGQTAPAEETTPTLRRPEEGVYVYATRGGESVAFGGASHEYPDQTTITVHHSECGYTTRWQALEERWDEFEICGSPERSWMRRITLYHEFYERGMTHVYTCGERSTLAAARSRPGERWTWECRTDGGTMTTTIDVLEFADRQVGGETIEAVHVRIHNTMSGHTEGERTADVWFARWTGLELHGEYHVDTQVESPMGPTRYVEDLTRTLTSLHPRR